jgi:hypothetical protein
MKKTIKAFIIHYPCLSWVAILTFIAGVLCWLIILGAINAFAASLTFVISWFAIPVTFVACFNLLWEDNSSHPTEKLQ